MANKQTSFSCLSTEIICNQDKLNRTHSPESTRTNKSTGSTNTGTAIRKGSSNNTVGSNLATSSYNTGGKNQRKQQKIKSK